MAAHRDRASRDATASHRLRRWLGRGLAVLLVAALLVGLAGWRYGFLDGTYHRVRSAIGLGHTATGGAPGPAEVAPPPGVDAPAVAQPAAVATAATGPALSTREIARAVTHDLHARDLGKHVLAYVAPLSGGGPAYTFGRGTATPASTTKLTTTTAALLALGPQHTFTTRVVAAGRGRVVLVGGGDPYLERSPHDPTVTDGVPVGADLTTLAKQTAAALKRTGVHRVSLGYDDSLFTGPAVSPQWPGSYISTGVVSPIHALWVDEGRPASGYGRVGDPPADAAADFAAALSAAGIRVTGTPTSTPHAQGPVLASEQSAPLSRIVERILMVSDNEGAEVLLRQLAVAQGRPASFVGGVAARAAVLGRAGVTIAGRLYDGSGLSRHDRLTPATLAAVLRVAASPDHPEARAVITGLPVAGFDGSLADRLDEGPHAALGRVRAKTGTLTGVTSLAGIAVDPRGTPMVFVLMADRVAPINDEKARISEDDVAADLGACACS